MKKIVSHTRECSNCLPYYSLELGLDAKGESKESENLSNLFQSFHFASMFLQPLYA